MNLPLGIAAVVFLSVFGGLMSAYVYLEEKYWRTIVARRLFGNTREAVAMVDRLRAPWLRTAQRLGQAAVPKQASTVASIRRLLSYGGFRDPQAVTVYFGIRIGAMLIFGVLYLFFALLTGHLGWTDTVVVFLPLAAGYYLPSLLLQIRIRSRQKEIFRELPDTLDLVLICLEAGLSFDLSLYRVSRELAKVSPVMSEEFGQYFMEIQSGLPRKSVLNNLAERNGVESLTSVVGVLVQSIRFGTNIAEALRVHISSMRTRRRQLAEEQGAKMSTRLTFPMVMLILPALFIVILGPALINIYERIQGGF
jgi:tight adherence protein C